MIDLQGHESLERFIAADAALHADIAAIYALAEDLGIEGRTIEDVGIAELRERGLSNAAIEFVIQATPAELRSVLGAYAAFIVKHGSPFGPGA